MSGDSPLVSYPSGNGYRDYSANDLNAFAYRAARFYGERYPARSSSDEKGRIIGLLGPPSFEFVVTMFGLWKLGHTVFLISPRLGLDTYERLINLVEVKDIIFAEALTSIADAIHDRISEVSLHELITEKSYAETVKGEKLEGPSNPDLDPEKENGHIAVIVHSAGSTGIPKPIQLSNSGLIQAASKPSLSMTAFSCIPFFHPFGMNAMNRMIYSGSQHWLFNASLPLTNDHLTNVIKTYKPEVFFCVPYALKLMAESEEGINALKQCKLVWYGGSSCPDGIGDMLNSNGVKMISDYGLSECGPLMSTDRPDGDEAWNYLRPLPHVKPFLKWEERDGGLFELICLKDLPMRNATNRDDGSYATSDLFIKHPNIENAFKFESRQDDIIVLANGEKVNPASLESKVKTHRLITEAVAFGAGKTELGLLLVKSSDAAQLSDEDVINEVWSVIEDGQTDMPTHGKIVKSMVLLLPNDTDYPKTLKGSLIRQQFYQRYETEIEDAYQDDDDSEKVALDENELREFIRNEIAVALKIDDCSVLQNDTDLFQLGVDSLQSTQLRRVFQAQLYLGGQELPTNTVYENSSIDKLTKLFLEMRQDQRHAESQTSPDASLQISQLVSKYGNFAKHDSSKDGQCFLLTGATGSLGIHLLAQLLNKDQTTKVYCLVRAKSSKLAQERVINALESRNIKLSESQMNKIQAFTADLGTPLLGLELDKYQTITRAVTTVIHAAWPVNFRLSLSSFETDIVGTRQLIDLCLSSQRRKPASFAFCSSISTIARLDSGDVPETLPPSLDCAYDMGYAQSKLVADHMCVNAAEEAQLQTYIFRIGQIIGDTPHGIWNNNEATPLMLQTARTLGVLPSLKNEVLRWLPVDIVAKVILDVLFDTDVPRGRIFNVVNPKTFRFTEDLLPKLYDAGLRFEEVPPQKWLALLRDSDQDPGVNPPVKLLDHFERLYDSSDTDNDTAKNEMPRTWSTENSMAYSRTFREGWTLDQNMVTKMLEYWQEKCWNDQSTKPMS